MFFRHSLTKYPPKCPKDTEPMWTGYSLIHLHANGRATGQDLGTSGSCMRYFSTLPFVRCNIYNECTEGLDQDNSYWLATSEPMTAMMTPVSQNQIGDYISRCSVCESPGNVSFFWESLDWVFILVFLGYCGS